MNTANLFHTIKRFVIYSLLLLSVPLSFLLSTWQWQSNTPEQALTPLILLLTETGSLPYAVLTSILFTFLLLWQNRSPLSHKALLLLIILSVSITQLEQSTLKRYFKLPRPYIAAINAEQQRSNETFYALTKNEQANIVQNWHLTHHQSPMLTKHRIKEIAYRFPSGHSIFSTSWAILFIFFCTSRFISAAIVLWSGLIMASRVWLGMHLPIDLIGGIILAIISNTLLIALFLYRAQQKPPPSLVETHHSHA